MNPYFCHLAGLGPYFTKYFPISLSGSELLDIVLTMSNKRKVNEGSSGYILAQFFDTASIAMAPSSARYRIDCLTTDTVVLDWTTLTVLDVTKEINITPSQNSMQDETNSLEIRRITVEGTDIFGNKQVADYEYDLINMLGL